MIERYLSVQDMIALAILAGIAIKAYQFYKEGKFSRKGLNGYPGIISFRRPARSPGTATSYEESAAAAVARGTKAKRCPSAGAGRILLLTKKEDTYHG